MWFKKKFKRRPGIIVIFLKHVEWLFKWAIPVDSILIGSNVQDYPTHTVHWLCSEALKVHQYGAPASFS